MKKFNPLPEPVLDVSMLKEEFYRKETVWHRDWKLAFPPSFREIAFYDAANNNLHRADIFTPSGYTIEFQNSPITLVELNSREAFYPNLIWVLNGKKFKGFKVLKHLPDVDDPKLMDYEFCHSDHLSMVRKVEIEQGNLFPKPLNFYHSELKDIKFTSNLYSFCWKQPHMVWYSATAKIIIDLGGHFLYELKQRPQLNGNYPYLKLLSRKTFIERYTPPEL
ncbi:MULTISPECIES: competence protein [unclassified Pedobacter]|uniref:competence protein n=1 Tax=unclassified Pedobacter TaxID=2628915 RepID=UPI001F11F4F3|nr:MULTISPECIES: competence protein [unclassified Pedobacter]